MPARTERPVYSSMHQRVRSDKGHPGAHLCACGKPATNWAYDHADPRELVGLHGGRQVAYSTDLEHYFATCRSCHTKLDRKRPDGALHRNEVVQMLGISSKTVYRWALSGKLSTTIINGRRLFDRAQVESMASAR